LDSLKAIFEGPFVHGFLFVALALFPIVNPPGMAPIFLNYTEGLDDSTTTWLARRISMNAFVLATASLIIGPYALRFFGLSLPAVQIAGGLLLATAGWRLLSKGQEDSAHRAPAASLEAVKSGAFYPLTLPLTFGPGSIAVMITLGSSLPDMPGGQALLNAAGAIVGLAATCVTIFICYSQAVRILRWLGNSGGIVLQRLSAFILLCIGVQIAIDGYRGLVPIHP
jgi:multiple antibiotic resistance protein